MSWRPALSTAFVALGILSGLRLSETRAEANTIVLGGTVTHDPEVTDGLTAALLALGRSYIDAGTTMTPNPALYGLGAGDIILIGNDGGIGPFVDYRPFLLAGGHVIAVGGSDYQPFRDWVSLYFNLTDTDSGWHDGGAWHTTAVIPASAGLPGNYSFISSILRYHMMGFADNANTVLYGENAEPFSVAAFRTYAGGGTFNYIALDLGKAGASSLTTDQTTFVTPWVNSALNAVPEPSAVQLGGLALAGFTFSRLFQRKSFRSASSP